MEEDFSGDLPYIERGWDNNVKNCNIDESRAIMISEEPTEYEYDSFNAGVIIGDLGLSTKKVTMCSCGKWLWLTFDNEEDAVAFKLRWL